MVSIRAYYLIMLTGFIGSQVFYFLLRSADTLPFGMRLLAYVEGFAPLALCITALIYWARKKDDRQFKKALWLIPIIFCIIEGFCLMPRYLSGGISGKGTFDMAFKIWSIFTVAFCVVTNIYIAFLRLFEYLLRKLKFIA